MSDMPNLQAQNPTVAVRRTRQMWRTIGSKLDAYFRDRDADRHHKTLDHYHALVAANNIAAFLDAFTDDVLTIHLTPQDLKAFHLAGLGLGHSQIHGWQHEVLRTPVQAVVTKSLAEWRALVEALDVVHAEFATVLSNVLDTFAGLEDPVTLGLTEYQLYAIRQTGHRL